MKSATIDTHLILDNKEYILFNFWEIGIHRLEWSSVDFSLKNTCIQMLVEKDYLSQRLMENIYFNSLKSFKIEHTI